MSDAVVKTVVGQCVEITEKNGWTSFSVDVGTQYPVRLSTKVAAIIESARAVGSEVATWTFKESQGNENPNKPGTYYTNKYLDKVEVGSQDGGAPETVSTASGTAAPVPTPHHEPIAPADKDRAIVRQACLKAAAQVYAGKGNAGPQPQREDGLLPEDPVIVEVIAAAARFETWVYRDISDLPF